MLNFGADQAYVIDQPPSGKPNLSFEKSEPHFLIFNQMNPSLHIRLVICMTTMQDSFLLSNPISRCLIYVFKCYTSKFPKTDKMSKD